MAASSNKWTAAMEARLIELLEERRLVVNGDFGRLGEKAGLTKQSKQAAWKEVMDQLNSEYPTLVATTSQLQKKLSNMAYRVKSKLDKTRRVPTGGGPAPPTITEVDDALLALHEHDPSFHGLMDPFDSIEINTDTWTASALISENAAVAHPAAANQPSAPLPIPPPKRRKLPSRESLNIECLQKEKLFYQEAREFVKEGRELVVIAKDKLSEDKCCIM